MADVGGVGRERRAGNPSNPEDRGQLILVTALSLAILFVALALILNTAIYTENLATRSSDIGGGTDAVRYHDAARVGVGGMIDYVNAHNNTSHSTLQTNLSTGVDDFRNRSSRLFVGGDRAVEADLESTVNGTRIGQTDGNRNFTNTSAEGNWTLAEDVNHVRKFRMNVSADDLLGLLSGSFKVTLDDGTDTWTMSLYTDATEIVLDVDGPTVSDECRVAADYAWVNVTDGTYAGEPCDPLDTFADGLSTPYTVRFDNGAEGAGTYTLIVDNDTLADSPGPHLVSHGSGQPFAAHAVYSANVSVTYETPRLFYNSTVRVAPGESDG